MNARKHARSGTDLGELGDLRRAGTALLERTTDLVRKLTALADRYEVVADSGDPDQQVERRANVAQMRDVAEAGQRLIADLRQPAAVHGIPAPTSELARGVSGPVREAQAVRRDQRAERRDQRASVRDKQARTETDDGDRGFAARFLAATDRDDAAGDRLAAQLDRTQARRDSEQAQQEQVPTIEAQARAYALVERLDARETVHQALGLLMVQSGASAAEAFEELLRLAYGQGRATEEMAALLVEEAVPTVRSGPHAD